MTFSYPSCQARFPYVSPLLLPFLLLVSALPLFRSQPSDPSYRLVWSEDFVYPNGTQPSPSIWNWETGGDGWGNNELEYYTTRSSNSVVVNNTLLVQGLYESYLGRPYTSARMNTQGKVMFYQGYAAARATINMFNGFWPAMSALSCTLLLNPCSSPSALAALTLSSAGAHPRSCALSV